MENILNKYEKGKLYPIPTTIVDEGYHADIDGNIYSPRGVKLTPFVKDNDYCTVTCKYKGRYISRYVHRLIATTFIPNPENKPTVNHLDGNPENNALYNLEWATQKEQLEHARATGLCKNFGEGCNFNKHSEENILEIIKYLKETNYSFAHIARTMKIDSSVIEDIYHKKRWKHLTKDVTFIDRPRTKFIEFKPILEKIYEQEDETGNTLTARYIAEEILKVEFTKELEGFIHHQRSYRRYKIKLAEKRKAESGQTYSA